MTALALHQPTGGEFRRYGAAALAIVLLHAALTAAVLYWGWNNTVDLRGVTPAIMLDLEPAPAAPTERKEDVDPGPEMQRAEAPPPEPPKPELIEQLPPTPVQPEPVVASPPKVEPKPEPKPIKPEPVRERVKKPEKKPPAPRTTAPQRAERVSPDAPSQTSGRSSAAAAADYRSILVAHLQRFKRIPSGGEVGTVGIRFTVTRSGRLSSSGLSRSSGIPALDREALEMLQRAQPLPAFPPEMRQASESYSLPLNYIRR
jgi:periplasmic protein TonB